MTPIDLGSYKSIYLQTGKEYINNLSLSYSKLIQDSNDKESIKTIHIASHSLKSQSQVMSFNDITDLCLNIEKISSDILSGTRKVDNEFLTLLKNSIDELNLKLTEIEKTP